MFQPAGARPAFPAGASGAGGSGSPLALPTIQAVYPPKNAAGGPLLILGSNLADVTQIQFGDAAPVPIDWVDTSTDVHQLIATVPNQVSGDTSFRLLTSSQLESLRQDFEVVPEFLANEPPAPSHVVLPDRTIYFPAVSNDWANECDLGDTDGFFFSPQSPIDGGVEFHELHDDDTPFRIDGTFIEATHLFNLQFHKGDHEFSYVGVMSDLGGARRLVLFPTDDPAHQLILFICDGGDTSCKNPLEDGGVPFPGPPGCQ